MKTHAHFRGVLADRVGDVRAQLQITRILRRLAVDEARTGGRNHRFARPGSSAEEFSHWRSVGVQAHDVVDLGGQGFAGKRFEVGHEIAGQRHVGLGLLVVAGDDRVVRSLEQTHFAIVRELDAACRIEPQLAAGERGDGSHHRRGDVVLHLHFFGRNEILTQLEGAPLCVAVETHAQVAGDDTTAEHLQFVARGAVHHVDRELLVPFIAPFRAVETLDQEHQRENARRDAVEPGVVFVGVTG